MKSKTILPNTQWFHRYLEYQDYLDLALYVYTPILQFH